jgi:hypothetical protein
MAISVSSCKFLRAGQTASIDDFNLGTYSATWRATITATAPDTDKQLGPKTVASQATLVGPDPLPAFRSVYNLSALMPGEVDALSFAQGYNVQFVDQTRRVADITVTFTPPRDDGGGSGQLTAANRAEANPFLRKAEMWWDEESYTRIADKDKDGVPLTNAAGRSFDRPPTIEETRGVLVAEFAVPTLAAAIILNRTYSNAVNSTAWTWANNAAVRTVVCRYARAGRLVEEGGYSYYPMSMAFAFTDDGTTWDESILNEGYGYLDGGVYKKALADGEPVSEPILLTAGGAKLAEGVAGNYRTFRIRREVDFNTLTTGYLAP